MLDLSCPNCGAPIGFKSSVSVQTTCTYCRSMVVRHDKDLEAMGQVAELLQDMSPFQVGTTGRFQGKPFSLLGRVKAVYDGGSWSEWHALFDDGRQGWLAEAQGFYMMTFEVPDATIEHPPVPRAFSIFRINGREWVTEDAREVVYAASEGELPFRWEPGEAAWSVDLRTDDGGFGTVALTEHGKQAFVGEYVDFDAMDFQNLRTIDGW